MSGDTDSSSDVNSSDSVSVSVSDLDSDSFNDIINGINNDSKMIQNDLADLKLDMGNLTKEEFNNHLQGKIIKLGGRLKILQIKYQNYKSWYDKLNVMIIIISSLLSIFEAFRNEMEDIIEGDEVSKLFLI